MVLPIVVYGDPLLRKVCDDIDQDYEGLDTLISDMFETIEAWDDKETKRVGRSLRRHVEKVIRFAKDTPFEQEVKKRVGKLVSSEGEFAEKIAQTSRSHTYKVAEHIPFWRTH